MPFITTGYKSRTARICTAVINATSGIRSIIGGKPSTQGVEIDCDENGKLRVSLHLCAKSGQVLPELANNVRRAVADAISGQVGVEVGSVDLYIDNIQFDN